MSGSAGRASLVLKKAIACVLLPGFVCVLAACAQTPTTSGSASAAGIAAISEYNAQTLKALNSGDVDALNALMADDYVIFLPGRPPIQGIAGIRTANKNFLGQWNDQETWTPVETVVQGDLGFQRGTFELVLTPKAGGASRRSVGTYLHVYQKQPNGKWMLTRAMTTTLPEKTP